MRARKEKKSLGARIRQLVPEKEKLEGSWFHRVLGERLFAPELWRFSRMGVAGGTALGVFIAMTPTISIHMTAAVLLGFLLRVNIPVAVAACWIVNPLNALIVYGLQYKIGVWIVGLSEPEQVYGYAGKIKNILRYAKPLAVGSLVMATPSAMFSYALVFFGWETVARFLTRNKNDDDTSGGDDA